VPCKEHRHAASEAEARRYLKPTSVDEAKQAWTFWSTAESSLESPIPQFDRSQAPAAAAHVIVYQLHDDKAEDDGHGTVDWSNTFGSANYDEESSMSPHWANHHANHHLGLPTRRSPCFLFLGRVCA
jgi:hypothetical protein